ncbi:MAG: hypothetical protein ACRCYS_01700, partial [Beijerinckiaceae bacterium]
MGFGALGLAGAQNSVREKVTGPLYASSQRQRQETGERRRLEEGISYGSLAGVIGNVAGNALQALGPGQVAKGTALAGVINPVTIRGNALAGGVVGSVQPYEEDGEQALNALAGAGGGALGAGAVKGVGMAARALARSRVPKVDRKAAEQILAAAEGRRLDFQETQTPGGIRSFGEGTADPGVMALERNSRRLSPGQFTPNDTANNMARVQLLKGISGTDDEFSAAKAGRESSTESLRERAFTEGDQFDEAREQAQVRARQLLTSEAPSDGLAALRGQLEGLAQGQGGRSAVQQALRDVARAASAAPDTVPGLYRVRQTIGDMLDGKAGVEKSYARAAARELMQARGLVDEEISRRMVGEGPSAFRAYLNAYQQKSGQVNRMQVGRRLMKLATGKVPDEFGVPQVQPFKFSAANANLDKVAQDATGFKKAAADKILRPEDLGALRAIQDDMSRIYKRASNPAQPGSATMEAGRLTKKMAMNAASRAVPLVGQGAGSALDYLEGKAGEALKERLGYVLANGKVA